MSGSELSIQPLQTVDSEALLSLFRRAALGPGLARDPDEITPDYVAAHIAAAQRGLGLVAIQPSADPQKPVGVIVATVPGPRQFHHVLSDLTMAVDPEVQGLGIGRALFVAFLETVRTRHPQISRVELMCRADNGRALKLYAQLGFVLEGRLSGRVKDSDGTLSDDLVLGLTL